MAKGGWQYLLAIVVLIQSTSVFGHSTEFSVLTIKQIAAERYSIQWKPNALLMESDLKVAPQFNVDCQYRAPITSCDSKEPLHVHFPNLPKGQMVVAQWVQTNGETDFQLINSSQSLSGETNAFISYLWIGIEHIILGYDHLVFVIMLLVLVGFHKDLIWCVTAFTLSHSLSLGLSTLGIISIAISPVEIIIALSIVLLARECLDHRETFTKQFPWIVALGFGLIHGLGFASALSDIGLPRGQEILALLAFNIGVEVGQLIVVAILYTIHLSIKSFALYRLWIVRLKYVSSYFCGCIGTYWVVQRMVALF